MPDTFDRPKAALAARYGVERQLGSGGMATVYLAEDLKHHRKVAVNVPTPALLVRFERDARRIALAATALVVESHRARCVFLGFVLVSLGACDGDAGSPSAVEDPVASVTVTPDIASLILGIPQRFTATLKDAAGNVLTGRLISWSSSDIAVATVTSEGAVPGNGFVTGVGPGSSTIEATAEGKRGTASVTVRALVFTTVSTGGGHSCGLTTDGEVYCWGRNSPFGDLGDGTTNDRLWPVSVAGGRTYQTVSTGRRHNCGVTTSGDAFCWGWNGWGELGDGTVNGGVGPSRPMLVSGGLSFELVSAGDQHTCGVITGGDVYCWGRNDRGQIGNGTSDTLPHTAPQLVSGGHTFRTVSAGRLKSCGVTTDGDGYCWGARPIAGETSTPSEVPGGLSFAVLSVGWQQACGVTTSGAAYCWGPNASGQLGDSTTSGSTAPVPVAGGHSFGMLSAGRDYSCGVTTGGQAYCWGDNDLSQLGDGTLTSSTVPVLVLGGLTFESVAASAGGAHTCGVTVDGTAYCWGLNRGAIGTNGALGDGTTLGSAVPVRVLGQ